MKWESRIIQDGETRTIRKFLWIPVRLIVGDKMETRWLETAFIQQMYHSAANLDGESYWQDVVFAGEGFVD